MKTLSACLGIASLSPDLGLGNFIIEYVKDGDLRLHPIVVRLVDAETLAKMDARQSGEQQ
jgi:hypothetical protein